MTIEEQEAIYKEIDDDLQLNAILNTVERKGKAIALAMLADGLDVSKIVNYTGLSVEEVEAPRSDVQ